MLGAVFYELHVGTFTADGTLDAARRGCGHLVGLGVDVVELMPVGAFPGRWGWGYDGAHPGAVHAAYGGPAALQRFVDAAHAGGPRRSASTSSRTISGRAATTWLEFGPYFTERAETPWGPAVNLDGVGSAGGAALDPGPGAGLAARLPSRRAAAGRRARAARRVAATAAGSAVGRDRPALAMALGRPLALVAETDLNDPRTVEPTSAGGPGDDGAVGRRHPPRAALGTDR